MNPNLCRAISATLLWSLYASAAEIHDAVKKGDAVTVDRLLKKDHDLVNLPDDDTGMAPLLVAVDEGNLEMVTKLLKAGAQVNAKSDDGTTAVLRAAAITNHAGFKDVLSRLLAFYRSSPGAERVTLREGLRTFWVSVTPAPEEEAARLAILRLLVTWGGNLKDTLPLSKSTPLHVAISFSNLGAVEFLIEKGADVSAPAMGSLPIHAAALRGKEEVVKALLSGKAEINASHVGSGARPLHFAVVNGDMATIRLLLEHGANVNAVNKSGAPALHASTWSDEIFNLLLEHGAHPNMKQSEGTTTLHKACQEGSTSLVEKLIPQQRDLEARDGANFTPLLNAAEAGRLDLIKLLVAAGANLKATDQTGRGALHLTAGSQNFEAVQFLVEQKLNIHELSDNGITAVMEAAGYGRLETVKFLLQSGARVDGTETKSKQTALMVASFGPKIRDEMPVRISAPMADFVEVVALLLKNGAKVSATDSEGKTALHHAAAGGNTEAIKLLIERGAEVDPKDTLYGRTPLHNAAYSGNAETAAVLLAHGADISAADNAGFQPIHAAARGGNLPVLKFFLEKGADIAATESHGGTPLHLATMEGKLDAVRLLLELGAPVGKPDQFKNTPLAIAATSGYAGIVRVLLENKAPVNSVDMLGNTALHAASIVRIEGNDFKRSADIPLDGQLSAEQAIQKSTPEAKLKIVKLLLERGAKPHMKNLEGAAPIDAAIRFGTPEILHLLESPPPPAIRNKPAATDASPKNKRPK